MRGEGGHGHTELLVCGQAASAGKFHGRLLKDARVALHLDGPPLAGVA
jgi:hypothetical protein